MQSLEQYILPIPYEPYDKFERHMEKDFNTYKNKIEGWVNKNKSKLNKEQKLVRLKEYFNNLHGAIEENISIYMLLEKNIDKVEFINDFSGVAFGVVINERLEQLRVMYATPEDKELIPNFDIEDFKSKNNYEKVEWLLENSKFVPIRCLYEDIHLFNSSESYLFGHIKKDSQVMFKLKSYLDDLKYTPSDKVFYFIEYSNKADKFYLRRDLEMSPTKKAGRRIC